MKPFKRAIVSIRKNLESQSYLKFATLQLIFNLATGFLFLLLFLLYAKLSAMEVSEIKRFSKPIGYYLAILPVGILIETFFFQYLPYQLFRLFWRFRKKKSPLSFIVISALAFGLYHLRMIGNDIIISTLKVVTCSLGGIILSTSYYILTRKRQYPFLTVFLIHLIYDFIFLGLAYLIQS